MAEHVQHDVNLRNVPTKDDEGKGVQAILRAFLNNPVAAVEVFLFIGGLYGLYYTMNYKIESASAASEQHYKDLTLDLTRTSEKMIAKLDAFGSQNDSQTADIKALFARGDLRWASMGDKMSSIEVRFTKAEDKLDNIRDYLAHKEGTGPVLSTH